MCRKKKISRKHSFLSEEAKIGRTKMADQKLNLNINLGEIQYMRASS